MSEIRIKRPRDPLAAEIEQRKALAIRKWKLQTDTVECGEGVSTDGTIPKPNNTGIWSPWGKM